MIRTAGTIEACAPASATAAPPTASSLRTIAAARLADYLELTKPRIAVLALTTVSLGFALGSAGPLDFALLGQALLGIALVAASSSALNQYVERESDATMPRTANRPLPAGRLSATEVLLFGLATGLLGVGQLFASVNATTALLAAATWLLYVAVYTPLKRRTALCTAVGAIPGALPPVLGWTAAGGSLNASAFALFGILFLWQFPHFLAIGWLYREQYRRAGLKMLPGDGSNRRVTGFSATAYALALVPMSLLPSRLGLAGVAYCVVALLLGAAYVGASVRFLKDESPRTARGLLWTSLVYLPAAFVALTWDHFRLLQ